MAWAVNFLAFGISDVRFGFSVPTKRYKNGWYSHRIAENIWPQPGLLWYILSSRCKSWWVEYHGQDGIPYLQEKWRYKEWNNNKQGISRKSCPQWTRPRMLIHEHPTEHISTYIPFFKLRPHSKIQFENSTSFTREITGKNWWDWLGALNKKQLNKLRLLQMIRLLMEWRVRVNLTLTP